MSTILVQTRQKETSAISVMSTIPRQTDTDWYSCHFWHVDDYRTDKQIGRDSGHFWHVYDYRTGKTDRQRLLPFLAYLRLPYRQNRQTETPAISGKPTIAIHTDITDRQTETHAIYGISQTRITTGNESNSSDSRWIKTVSPQIRHLLHWSYSSQKFAQNSFLFFFCLFFTPNSHCITQPFVPTQQF